MINRVNYMSDDTSKQHAYVRMDSVKLPSETRVNTCCESYDGLYELAREMLRYTYEKFGMEPRLITPIRDEDVYRYMDYLQYDIKDIIKERRKVK